MVRRRRPVHQPLLLRARTRLRTPAASWALAVLLGGLTFAFGRQTLSGAPASEAWGTPRAVVVATHPIAAGDPITPANMSNSVPLVRDLPALAKVGLFRPELLWRLDVVSLRVPALRERTSRCSPTESVRRPTKEPPPAPRRAPSGLSASRRAAWSRRYDAATAST